MSQKETLAEYVKLICDLFNVNAGSVLTYQRITASLQEVDPRLFLPYAEQRFTNPKYKYLSGYQKFIEVMKDFIADGIKQIPHEKNITLAIFCKDLFSRVTTVMDEVHWHIQTSGMTIDKFISYEQNFTDKQMEVLNEIGVKSKIYHMCRFSRETLKVKIEEIVYRKALLKLNPSIQIEKPRTSESIMITRLQESRREHA